MPEPVDPDILAGRLLDDANAVGAGWRQVDLSLGERPFDVVAAALLDVCRERERAGSIDQWFFVRKPPGVRVRVHLSSGSRGDDAANDGAPGTIVRWLDPLREAGLVADA